MKIEPLSSQAVWEVFQNLRDEDRQEVMACRPECLETPEATQIEAQMLAEYSKAGVVFRAPEGVIAAGGIVPVFRGTGSFWFLSTPLIGKHGVGVTRFLRRGIFDMLRSNGFHRATVHSVQWFKRAHRWIAFLGGRFEGQLSNYGADRTDFKVFGFVVNEE